MDLLRLGVCVCFPYIGSIAGSPVIIKNLEWYKTLKKPKFTPPPWVFGPIWGIIYGSMGLASFFLLHEAESDSNTTFSLAIYSANLLLNWSWPHFFFGLHKLKTSVVIIIVTTIFAIQSAILFREVSAAAGYMMMPCVFFMLFASYLNIGTAILNQRSSRPK